MSVEIIRDRLRAFQPGTAQDEQHRLREVLHEIALSGLARAGFFRRGAFRGGTCLRILHGLRRFSEDLDFAWYVARGVRRVLGLLANAIEQQGPWARQGVHLDSAWLLETLGRKIKTTDWQQARRDVERFLGEPELWALEIWGPEYFLAQRARLSTLVQPP